MMNKLSHVALISVVLLSACNIMAVQPNILPSTSFGVLELNLNSEVASTARFESNPATRTGSFRENDAVFGTGTTQVISSTSSAFDYLVATFPVTHGNSSLTDFQNLTLYALAKNGNVGDTAIKTITNFGGVVNATEQTRLAKLVIPVHAVTTNGSGQIVMNNSKADFQAFTSSEVTDATTLVGGTITVADTILNYGFVARCNPTPVVLVSSSCTANLRLIAVGSEGSVSIGLRVPKAASSTAYKFVMNFVVIDDSSAKVTRGVYPAESVSNAENRASSVGASTLTQFGLNVGSTTLLSQKVDDVRTSKLGASIQALGIERISTGNFHSCGLNSSGNAYCWGENNAGQLGNGINTDSLIPVLVTGGLTFSTISTGGFHTCGVTTTATAYCWGANFGTGQLGNGTTTNSPIPVPVSGGLPFSSLSAGNANTCGLNFTGSAYCWGYNSTGQLGNGTTTTSPIPVPVSGGLTFSSINTGGGNTCGLNSTGSAYCWGANNYGQLGNGTTTNSPIPVLVSGGLTFSSISAGGGSPCGLNSTGSAYCWGYNFNGQLGNGTITNSSIPVPVNGGLTFSSISSGAGHACALNFTGTAYCWGANNFAGQLGDGTNTDSRIPVLVSGGLTFSSITTGNKHTCGVTSTGIAYCWGYNSYGQLGINSISNTNFPVAVVSSLFNL
jgi:alpha-tubulin suppressor-like RCC1 family protein